MGFLGAILFFIFVLFMRDSPFGILFMRKLHQVHFVFLLILLGLVFALCVFFLILSALNLYFWKGIHFSWSLDLVFPLIFILLIYTFWFRDLLRELNKKYEILLMVLFLAFFLFLASEALLFVSFFWASFHSSSSPTF